MQDIVLRTWNEKDSLTLRNDTLILWWMKKETVIPLSQIISFEIKDPKWKMRPGMITIRLGGDSGTRVLLTSFLSVGGSNNIEFPHGYDYLEAAHKMKDKIIEYHSAPAATQVPSAADEIRKFKALLDDGIITQDEFDAKKKSLLNL